MGGARHRGGTHQLPMPASLSLESPPDVPPKNRCTVTLFHGKSHRFLSSIAWGGGTGKLRHAAQTQSNTGQGLYS